MSVHREITRAESYILDHQGNCLWHSSYSVRLENQASRSLSRSYQAHLLRTLSEELDGPADVNTDRA